MTNQCSFLLSLGTSFSTIIPPAKGTAPYGTIEPPAEPNGSQKDASEEVPIGKQPWFWVVVVGVPVALVTSAVVAVPRLVKWNKRRRRLNNRNNDSVAQQSTPLVPRK